MERLQQERDPARRDLIYGFPQQFGALKDCLQSFLEGVFKPNAFEERALLRGVYFTSGTQEGSPIDRLIGSMAQSMNLTASTGAPERHRAQLLHRKALQRRGLCRAWTGGVNPKVERRRKWIAQACWPRP